MGRNIIIIVSMETY